MSIFLIKGIVFNQVVNYLFINIIIFKAFKDFI